MGKYEQGGRGKEGKRCLNLSAKDDYSWINAHVSEATFSWSLPWCSLRQRDLKTEQSNFIMVMSKGRAESFLGKTQQLNYA